MPPQFELLQPDAHHPKTPSAQPIDDEAERIRRRQARAQLENKLRIKKLEVNERRHKVGAIERDIEILSGEIEHDEIDLKRVEGELHVIESAARSEENVSKHAQGEMRDKDTELRRRSDETTKLEHEIDLLKAQIVEKEKRIMELKDESRDFMRGKEELRREYELEHFSANTELSRAHDKSLQLQRFRQERMRKEHELEKRKRDLADLKKDLMFKEQEVVQIEGELRRGDH